MNKGRRRKALCKVLGLIIVLLAVNGLLSWLLEPFCGSSQEMWQNFHAMEQMDTVYAGTSQCLQGIDPLTVDAAYEEAAGGSAAQVSYNMATNMQSLANSREAIASAIQEFGIRRAVLAVDHEILTGSRTDNARAEQSFWHAKAVTESSLRRRLSDDLRFMTSDAFIGRPASLTYLTPWVYNRTADLRLNLQEKRAGKVLNSDGHRNARGFQPSKEELDPDLNFVAWDEAKEWDQTAVSMQELSVSEENEKELAAIRDLCAANDVELIVVILPYPNWLSIYRREDILQTDGKLREIFSEEGFDTYDFNLLLPEYYDASGNEYYSDVGHMNEKGAERFSRFLGKFLRLREEGVKVDAWFRCTD